MSPALEPEIAQARDLFARGRFEDAAGLCQRVLDRRKNHPWANALLGQIAFEQQRYDLAASQFQKAITADRKESFFLGLLGTTRLVQGSLREALACFEKALKLEPGYLDAMAGKAETLERSGKRDRAIAYLAPHVKSGKANPRMILAYARSLQAASRDEDVVAAVDRALEGRVPDVFRRSLLLVEGRSLDRLGDTARAFAAFEAGNAVGRVPYDAAAVRARHDDLRRAFAPDAMARLPRADVDAAPIFIVGLPRSASTLVEQILHAHPAVTGVGETHDVVHYTGRIPKVIGSSRAWPDCIGDLTAETATAAARTLVERMQSHAPRADRIADKSLENFECVGLLALLVPHAKVVHARRDPMDLGLSCFMHDLSPSVHPYATDLAAFGAHYRAYDDLTRYWLEHAPIAQHEASYEALVADFETEARRLVEFVGLPWDDACLRYHEAKRDVATISYDQVRQPIYASAVARWRRYADHLGPLEAALGSRLTP